MNTPKIENFLEKSDMNYLFCLLSKLEIQRINTLPAHVKQRFPEKITVMAMEHVAENEVPDYISEIAEAELAMAQESSPFPDEDIDFDSEEETIDDSTKFIEDLEKDDLDNYSDDDDEDESFDKDDDED
ncbi:MAG TPA: hypothetical protein PL124_05000 [Candidatus Cloacimonadota bacterium]|nr:hypothetical protein [Candidatus Cloacimonadota bacterium]HPS38753.1 hypothetical protein [Candidatus Cloacimonadota bacterium]